MLTLDELISKRYSVRSYDSRAVEKEKIEAILQAARLAPSACNAQPWRFIVIDQKELKEKFIEQCMGVTVPNTWAKSAPVIIVAASQLQLLTHKVGELIQGVNYHLIDIGIALEHCALKATELELGTCYIGWFKADKIKKLLNLPKNWKPECLLTLGYSLDKPRESIRKPLEEIVLWNPKAK